MYFKMLLAYTSKMIYICVRILNGFMSFSSKNIFFLFSLLFFLFFIGNNSEWEIKDFSSVSNSSFHIDDSNSYTLKYIDLNYFELGDEDKEEDDSIFFLNNRIFSAYSKRVYCEFHNILIAKVSLASKIPFYILYLQLKTNIQL